MSQTITDTKIISNTKYREIVKHGRFLGSFDYYIASECLKAEKDNAPLNAIYKKEDGTWAVND